MRDIQSLPWTPTQGPPVSIHPKWFSGTEEEVNKYFADFKQIFADDDFDISSVIAQTKETNNIRDAGTFKIIFVSKALYN